MSNEHYLVVSYFGGAVVCLALTYAIYRLLREPFERLAEAALKHSQSLLLRRMLPMILALAAGFGFLGVSYTYDSCRMYKYDEVVKDRAFMRERNRKQVESTSANLMWAVLAISAVVTVCVAASRKSED